MEGRFVFLLSARHLSPPFMQCLALSTSLAGANIDANEDDLARQSSCQQIDLTIDVSENPGVYGSL